VVKSLIFVLAVVFSLAVAPMARAGKARSGQVTAGKAVGLSKAARNLVGTWRMVALELGGTRRPWPGGKAITVTLRGNGTLSWKNAPRSKKLKKARWSVKGKHLLITLGKKIQKIGYSLRANEVSVTMPGNARYRIILQRVSKRVKP